MTTRTLHVYTIETQMVSATRADSKQWSWPGIRSHAAIGLGSAIVAAIMVGSALVMHLGPWAEEPLPVFWPTPTFSLIDQQGRPFGSGDLTGRAVLFSFVYTLPGCVSAPQRKHGPGPEQAAFPGHAWHKSATGVEHG